MRVLIVSHSYVAEENRKNLAAFPDSVRVVAIAPDWVDDSVLGRLVANDDKHISVFRRISLPRAQYLLASRDLGMSKFKPDIVHIEYDPWSPIFWQTLLVKRIFAPKAALVCTVKKNTFRPLPAILQYAKDVVARFFVSRTEYFLAVNLGVQKIYRQRFNVDPDRISILQHLGIDTSLFSPSSAPLGTKKYLQIGYCGKLDSHKGVMELISAVESVRTGGLDLRLSLLGGGLLRDNIQSQGFDWLQMLPAVPHHRVPDFLQTLDIFVLPALVTADHEEHDGHALMEAMSCGVACVGTRSGVIPEILNEGAGLIVDAGDSRVIADAILSLALDPNLRNKTGLRARERVCTEYSLEAISNRKLNLYKRLSSEI